jgi:glycerol kinase
LVDLSGYVLSVDKGTTSALAVLYDEESNVKAVGQREFTQIYPKPGWVEHNPEEIWNAQLSSIKSVLSGIDLKKIKAIGVTNQRETTVIWNKKTGTPIYNTIVWQCRRTSELVESIVPDYGVMIKEKTGLIIDSYFSAPKAKWILDNVPGARKKAKRGDLYFGTIDSYLI